MPEYKLHTRHCPECNHHFVFITFSQIDNLCLQINMAIQNGQLETENNGVQNQNQTPGNRQPLIERVPSNQHLVPEHDCRPARTQSSEQLNACHEVAMILRCVADTFNDEYKENRQPVDYRNNR